MTTWVCKNYGIISHIRISIESLRIGRARNNGIRRNKSSKDGVVVSCFVEVEVGSGVAFFSGVFVRHIGGPGVDVGVAVGQVGVVFFGHTGAVGEDAGGPEVVGVEVAR